MKINYFISIWFYSHVLETCITDNPTCQKQSANSTSETTLIWMSCQTRPAKGSVAQRRGGLWSQADMENNFTLALPLRSCVTLGTQKSELQFPQLYDGDKQQLPQRTLRIQWANQWKRPTCRRRLTARMSRALWYPTDKVITNAVMQPSIFFPFVKHHYF